MGKNSTERREARSFIEEICTRVSEGETLNEVCAALKDYGGPPASTFRSWCLNDAALFAQYARARELQWEYWADKIRIESATPQIGEKTETDASGNVIKVTTGDTVERSRLSVDSMKWLLSKLAPRKYGDRQQIDQTTTVEAGDTLTAMLLKLRQGGDK